MCLKVTKTCPMNIRPGYKILIRNDKGQYYSYYQMIEVDVNQIQEASQPNNYDLVYATTGIINGGAIHSFVKLEDVRHHLKGNEIGVEIWKVEAYNVFAEGVFSTYKEGYEVEYESFVSLSVKYLEKVYPPSD